MAEVQEKKLRTINGLVITKSGNKTVKVVIEHRVSHPKYGKFMTRRTKLSVHDEQNQSGVGDVIEIAQSRPYSKTKSWRLVKVLQKAANL
jgi:small subunit ribosomal protein S17